jgi:DNA-directed RNA polymerase subunit RPC12/RpoP
MSQPNTSDPDLNPLFRVREGGLAKEWAGLYCPNCDDHGVRILPNPRTYGMKDFKATCQKCGYSVNNMGRDGNMRAAVDEWKSLCEHALEVKKQLLGATTMKSEQLELDVNAFIGRTPWFDGGEAVPDREGWYDVRFKMSDEERKRRKPAHTRRYWSAKPGNFSWAVVVGEEMEMDGAELGLRKRQEYKGSFASLEWRGLTEQHPDLRERPKRTKIAGFTF